MLSAALALSACNTSDGKSKATDETSSAAPTPTATTAPTQSNDPMAAPKAAVLEAYNSFWDEQVKAYAKGDTEGTDFGRYAAALALSSTKRDLKDLRSKGIVATGSPSHNVDVTQIDVTAQVPKARLTDCLDISAWTLIYSESGKSVEMPEKRLTRYVNQIKAEKWGKQWKIVDVTPEQQAC
ncbi:hypothetical protein [Streptomyces sp. CL12-4]|uniref:hypothetical protein n=1 Tax=Streptomyces sp. CL12-4 TaxID=2810306 RepID=UPI001EFA3ECF|nr:hypothetical protein [Streptomyces sp. CL12-4]MCG8971412.1 hypothetical protein [Streptomyces sp. CL12-4]